MKFRNVTADPSFSFYIGVNTSSDWTFVLVRKPGKINNAKGITNYS